MTSFELRIKKWLLWVIAAVTFLLIVVSCSEDEKEIKAPPVQMEAPVVQPAPQPQSQYLPPDQVSVPPYQQQPVIINQQPAAAPAHDNTMTNMLLGGLIGHAIGSSTGRAAIPPPSYSQPVVHQTVVRKVYVQPRPTTSHTQRTTFRSSSSSFSHRR